MYEDNFYEELSEEMEKRTTMIEALKKIVYAFDSTPGSGVASPAMLESSTDDEGLEESH